MASSPKPLALLASLSLTLLGCGVFGKKSSPSPSDPGPYPTAPATIAPNPPPGAPKEPAPLITRLVNGTVIPAHLKATSLLVNVTANDAKATFDCQVGNLASWTPCNAGSGYDFGRLAHSQNYSVKIRAHGTDGRLDANPLLVSFYADMLGGIAPTLPGGSQSLAAKVVLPTSVADLPVLVKSTTPATLLAQSRVLQVGAYYAMTVPGNAQVAGFGTDKTYNAVTHTLLLLPSGGSIIGNNGICTADYQRVVSGPDGAQYCDATPSAADQLAAGNASLPRNFLEVALNPAASQHEALLVASLDAAASGASLDTAVTRLSISARCSAASGSGQSPLPLINQFYAGSAQTQTLVWCRTKAVAGRSQWLGMINASLTADPAGPSLRVIYTVDAGQMVLTSTQFIERVTQALLQMLTPIAPLSPSA